MKIFSNKTWLTAIPVILLVTFAQAQFDDVYYDPDLDDPVYTSSYTETTPAASSEYTYYDDDSYDFDQDDEYNYYVDDYDYYYTSRIRRFHRPYAGFDFYAPAYVDYSYYDPYYASSYYYPGSSIYISFGSNSYWDYRRWRRWNRWNSWNNYYNWNNWCITPATYYYNYNNWCGYGGGNYWSGYHGYHNYSNYYNNYYSTCPFPVGNYNGITHTTIHDINAGGTRGSYYGPRITGNTGSSPRGPVNNPGINQPVYEGRGDVAKTNPTTPTPKGEGEIPGRAQPPASVNKGVDQSPASLPDTKGDIVNGRDVITDREIKREEAPGENKRPIFRPDSDKYRPYPTNDPPARPNTTAKADQGRTEYKPYTPDRTPTGNTREGTTTRTEPARPGYTPTRDDEKPAYRPGNNSGNNRPSYTPPPTRNDNTPSYRPPVREDNTRSNDRPSYTPPTRTQESEPRDSRPSYTPPSRNDDRPSYSPPARTEPSRSNDSGRSYSPPTRSEPSSGSRSSSGGSGGGGSSSSSPRGRG